MRKLIALVSLFIVLLAGCKSRDSDAANLVIMSWNVQNLFDDVDNGSEYREFDPGLGDWNYDCFNRKAAVLADVITSCAAGGPDLVLLQEIENANALRHLNENCLKASSYSYSLFFPTENSAVGTAVLSRFPFESANSHAVNTSGKIMGRNISKISLKLPESDETLVVFLNHWKSKLGGARETEVYRIAAANLLSELMEGVSGSESVCVLAAGDFNESHDEYLRIKEAYTTAIMPEGLAGGEGLGLFNPWFDSESPGSYYYDGSWETIDQFFLGEAFTNDQGWDYSSFRTAVFEFNSTSQGYPLSWSSSVGNGCSDHFPILLELKFCD